MEFRLSPSQATKPAMRFNQRLRLSLHLLGLSRSQLHAFLAHLSQTPSSLENMEALLAIPPSPWEVLRQRLALDLAVDPIILEHLMENLDELGFLGESIPALSERLKVPRDSVEGARQALICWEGRGLGCLHFLEYFRFTLAGGPSPLHRTVAVLLRGKTGGTGCLSVLRFLGRRLREADFQKILGGVADGSLALHPRMEGQGEWNGADGSAPDLELAKIRGRWQVVTTGGEGEDGFGQWDREKDGFFPWIREAIRRRRQFLDELGAVLIDRQMPFLEEGILALKAMEQRELAAVLGLSPPSISRAIRSKSVKTPRGNFCLRHLFCGEISRSPAVMDHCLRAIFRGNARAFLWSNRRLCDEIMDRFSLAISRKMVGRRRNLHF
jgi:DNA-directed RNA polymerase specialized sigma54-like protein